MFSRFLMVCAIAMLSALPAQIAAAAMSEDEASRLISERFDVQVLKVRAGEIDDRPVWLLTVMRGGGTRNDAFQVSTLAVDQETGELVPAFRHRESGYDLPAVRSGSGKSIQRPDAARARRIWR